MGRDGHLGQFIATETFETDGTAAERQVWEAVRQAFRDRPCLAYWRYPIFAQTPRKEPDILIADARLGSIVIEVKAIAIDQITAITGHRWQFQNFYTREDNPYQQAERQLFSLLDYCNLEPALRHRVAGRALVALPNITPSQWQQRGFDRLPSCPPILFDSDLSPSALLRAIARVRSLTPGSPLTGKDWQLLRAVLGGTPVLRPPPRRVLAKGNSRASTIERARQCLHEFDVRQERIGKQIPPGPQRIRGIAGSGKTVLLCQKAAHMHLKHPEWDIALVFSTRTLYEPIRQQVQTWLHRFSHGRVNYDPERSKLRLLHAWGSKGRSGLYGVLCEAAGVERLKVNDLPPQPPSSALATACHHLLQRAEIPIRFDAILIDEGQDFVADNPGDFGNVQPFYVMAYRALRSPHRLIWAYDEAQSLETLNIPTARELFGDEFGNLVSGHYPDGIPKTEILGCCYRTPEPILTAAHAIAMGWLRPDGMLGGMTRAEDWQAIGYDIEGDWVAGDRVVLERPPQNSPNPVPQLGSDPVLTFETYRSRRAELHALADNLWHNLRYDGLRPSGDILVIVLGENYEAMQLETEVARFLMEAGLDIFIPTTAECNAFNRDRANPDRFWCVGGITVSRIYRAKGQEADTVYVVGLDNLAKAERNPSLRNQLFVAMTRSRGWVKLSGIGNYPFYAEVRAVLASGSRFELTPQQRPQRDLGIGVVAETLRRYAAGDRDFQNLDLSGAQLAGVDLRGANLIGAQLCRATLCNARLDGVKLAIANLSGADLTGACLRDAKLVGANLNRTILAGADLAGANLDGADLANADLTDTNLAGTDLSDAIFPD